MIYLFRIPTWCAYEYDTQIGQLKNPWKKQEHLYPIVSLANKASQPRIMLFYTPKTRKNPSCQTSNPFLRYGASNLGIMLPHCNFQPLL